jgi:hypothetical protein
MLLVLLSKGQGQKARRGYGGGGGRRSGQSEEEAGGGMWCCWGETEQHGPRVVTWIRILPTHFLDAVGLDLGLRHLIML